jgi:hypothetical protein
MALSSCPIHLMRLAGPQMPAAGRLIGHDTAGVGRCTAFFVASTRQVDIGTAFILTYNRTSIRTRRQRSRDRPGARRRHRWQ